MSALGDRLREGSPPEIFGLLPEFNASNPGPHICEPRPLRYGVALYMRKGWKKRCRKLLTVRRKA